MAKTSAFGIKSLVRKTPEWAKWMFRVTMILTTVVAFVIAADPGIVDSLKVRFTVYLKGFDMLVWMLSKLWGIKDDKASYGNFDPSKIDQ